MEQVKQLGQRWEYKVIHFDCCVCDVEGELNILGKSLWELVSSEWTKDFCYCTCVLKRPA